MNANALPQAVRSAVGLVLLVSVGLASAPADASIRYVRQEIRGMDCAPCAYGMQKSLRKLDGVQDVQVSLNDAMGTLTLAPDNAVTFEQIRAVVRDGGFKPMAATARIAGSLERDGDRWRLTTQDGRRYTLDVDSGDSDQLQALADARQVLVTVRVPVDAEPVEHLRVEELSELTE